MRAIFLADAHLRHPDDENYQKLLSFLDSQIGHIDGLFLLGDIFEFWIGYRHVVFSAYLPLLTRLQELVSAGCTLYYVEGNHDFNLGAFFENTLQCTVITDEAIVDWDNQKICLCHGDLINKELKGYRLLRAFWRSRPIKLLAEILPPDQVWHFGHWLSNKSGKYKSSTKRFDPAPLVRPYALTRLNSCDAFICGHFHHPARFDESLGTTIILGDCIQQSSYLELTDGQFTLKTF
ncbi:MAG: UDP-2,3-diacylglucosamine diphosphatase [Desulfuromonas sp.]|nr:MAG: UDP-2,3-diacylglucosamine diphosphatase [Desulfuromonas sp.]